MKKKMALCTPISEELLAPIKEQCDITICGELKHGKGNVTEEMTREECMGNELIVLGDEYAGKDTIKAWADAGMKFIGVAKGTPATVDFDAITDAGLTLSYTPGRNRVAVAEYTIGLMIAMARKITISAAGLKNGEHTSEACDIYDVPDVKNVTFGPLDEKHPFMDYGIGLCIRDRVNTARAYVIDQKDFVEALQNKEIAGAAVDVYWKEPVPENHPLLQMRNVVCTPHMAGLTTDVDGWSGRMMAEEITAYLNGEKGKYLWKVHK